MFIINFLWVIFFCLRDPHISQNWTGIAKYMFAQWIEGLTVEPPLIQAHFNQQLNENHFTKVH